MPSAMNDEAERILNDLCLRGNKAALLERSWHSEVADREKIKKYCVNYLKEKSLSKYPSSLIYSILGFLVFEMKENKKSLEFHEMASQLGNVVSMREVAELSMGGAACQLAKDMEKAKKYLEKVEEFKYYRCCASFARVFGDFNATSVSFSKEALSNWMPFGIITPQSRNCLFSQTFFPIRSAAFVYPRE